MSLPVCRDITPGIAVTCQYKVYRKNNRAYFCHIDDERIGSGGDNNRDKSIINELSEVEPTERFTGFSTFGRRATASQVLV